MQHSLFHLCLCAVNELPRNEKKNHLFTSLACHFFTFSFKVPAKIRESQNDHFLMSQRVLLVKCLFYFPSVLFLFDYRTWIACKMSIQFSFFFFLAGGFKQMAKHSLDPGQDVLLGPGMRNTNLKIC